MQGSASNIIANDRDDDPLADTICVCGNGRSGTTIFFKVLGTHPQLGWVSNVIEKFPALPQLSAFSRLHPLAIRLGPQLQISRFIPKPAESLRSIRKCSDGLFSLPREIMEEDMTSDIIRSVRKFHSRILRFQGRSRLATKHTGFPRFLLWRSVFPRARFVQIIRDGRAVINSVMRVPWWRGTLDTWWWGPIPGDYMDEYENSGRRPAVLAAIGWKRIMDMYEEETANLPADVAVKQVRYSDFTADPKSLMLDVAKFAGLPESRDFERSVDKFRIHDADTAWRTGMDADDLIHIERVIGDHLAKYGFS